MKLTNISATSFKGRTFSEALSPVTLIQGSNFAGKSSITDAVRLALIGYLPELGKLPKSTFDLCDSTSMSVEATMESGFKITRNWELKNNSIKTKSDVPEEIAQAGELVVMLNAEEYFSKGPTERMQYVAKNCPAPNQTTVEEIVKRIMAATQDSEVVREKLVISPADTQEWVQEALTSVSNEHEECKKAIDRANKSIVELSRLRSQDVPNVNLHSLEQDIILCNELSRKVDDELAVLQDRANKAQSNLLRRNEITRELSSKTAGEAKLKTVQKTVKDIQQAIELTEWPKDGALEQANQASSDARVEQTKLDSEYASIREAVSTATRAKKELITQSKCPYCGAEGTGWKALKEVELDSIISNGNKRLEDLVILIKAAQDKRKEHESAASGITASNKSKSDSKDQLSKAQQTLSAAERAFARYATLETELQTIPDGLENSDRITALDDKRAIHQRTLSELTSQRDTIITRKGDLKRLAELETERETATKNQHLFGTAVTLLKEARNELVEQAFQPLLDSANWFFEDILKCKLSYRNGEIGTWRNGAWVSHRTMSGTEKALVYASLQAALSERSPLRIMLIDEIGRLDHVNRNKLVVRACQAVKEGRVHQFIGVGTEIPMPAGETDVRLITV